MHEIVIVVLQLASTDRPDPGIVIVASVEKEGWTLGGGEKRSVERSPLARWNTVVG